MQEVLAQLSPPRKHYRWYYSTAEANKEMAPREGLHDFLRGYFHLKRADANNNPHPLDNMAATELAKLPRYYVMPKELGMRETIAQDMTEEEVANMREKSPRWFPDSDLEIYVNEFARTEFQGGLNWYRVMTDAKLQTDVDVFAGKKIEVPILLISGTKDYLIYQTPGALEKMEQACSDLRGISWVEGAGHWPQQEQPEQAIEQIINFLKE
jgi:pimeloyl-ACP methyl ester carboxylesterase